MRVLFVGILIFLAAFGLALAIMPYITRYYSGPVSDHFDGRRFFIPGVKDPKNGWDVWKWTLTRKPALWPAYVAVQQTTPPARVEGSKLRVTFVGHATVLVQTEGLNILTDPVYSDRVSPLSFLGPKRVRVPGVAFEDLPKIDVVTVSHNHYDHLDLATLKRLWERDKPRILTPLGNDTIIRAMIPQAEIRTLDWRQSAEVAPGVALHCLPAQHWSSRWGWDRNYALWGSFALTTPHGNVYMAGDMGYNETLLRESGEDFGGFRLALIPIGAYAPRWFMAYSHMDPAQAVRTMQDLRAENALAMHYGTFQLTDEPLDAPVEELTAALAEQSITPSRFRTLDVGGSWQVP